MRPLVLTWMARNGAPTWMLPDYWQLAVIATLLGSVLALRIAARDGAAVIHTARAIACAYLGALVGGYLFEAARAVPTAVAAHSWRPVLHPGRAAYGGLLGAMGAATLYLRATRQPLAAFFDRVAIGVGLTFALVRTGCFLAGCDYGLPTGLPWGVRFPPGSLAALDHVRRGFVPRGGRSLPVHPTQLYEAGLGLLGAAGAALSLRLDRARDGRSFATFLAIYAAGRFAIELVRGDRDRGTFVGLSTAQWVSVAIGVAVLVWWRRRRGHSFGDLSTLGTALANRSAKNSALRACAGSIEKSGSDPGARSLA
jgi:phosphatidylglycerol---prolipoprotein diacylglyceryl transferase